jgi:type III secretory pathway component EscU
MDVWKDVAFQLPALGLFVVMIVYVLRYIEKMSENYHARMNEMTAPFQQAINHLADEIAESKKVNARLAQIILYHDATVKGENPEVLGTPQDLMNKIMNG